MPRMFGRHFAADLRDANYLFQKKKTTKTSRYWADTRWAGDQGDTPHCVGYGWTHWLVNSPMVSWLNPDGIYKHAQFVDEWKGTNYDGTSVRAGAKVLRALGVIASFQWASALDALVNAVLTTGPVVVGTDWHVGMEEPDADGIIRATGAIRGGHCYLINGVNTKKELFRMKNSWGQAWGLDGRAYIPFDDMVKLIKADGEVCLAVERLAKPPTRSRSSIQEYVPLGSPGKLKPATKPGKKKGRRQRRPIQQLTEK